MGERDGRKEEIAGCGEERVKEEKDGAWRKWKGKKTKRWGERKGKEGQRKKKLFE